MTFWFTFVCVFYTLCGAATLGILSNAKLPIYRKPRSPKLVIAEAVITRSSGSPVGYV